MKTPSKPRGSSPLARGLPKLCDAVIQVDGDHPRSRGVYCEGYGGRGGPVGSSPLARGLLYGILSISGVMRIIPARAGFTVHRNHKRSSLRDHPRSRGVYAPSFHGSWYMLGSSPLARGLLYNTLSIIAGAGIIPARAGFTAIVRLPPTEFWDHPRSRGVYDGTVYAATSNGGIIPARAGFTLGDPWNPNDRLPYQTASAFTADLAPARRRCGSAAVERRSTMTPSAA